MNISEEDSAYKLCRVLKIRFIGAMWRGTCIGQIGSDVLFGNTKHATLLQVLILS
jgi:hypothetical protein